MTWQKPSTSLWKFRAAPRTSTKSITRPVASSWTLGEDGDPLDALVMIPNSVFPGCVVECRAVGLYHMVDEAGGDDKVLCVPADVRFDDIKDIDDVNEYHKAEIKHFFEQYKALEPGKEVLPGDYWTGADAAEKEIIAARQRLADSEK